MRKNLQLNLSATTATLGTEESGRCRKVSKNKSQCMDCAPKKVAVVER